MVNPIVETPPRATGARTVTAAIPATAGLRHSVASVYLTSFVQGLLGVALPASSAVLRARLGIGDTLYGALFLPGLSLAFCAALGGRFLLRRWSLKTLFLFGASTQGAAMVLMAASGHLDRPLGLGVLIGALVLSGPAGGIMGITLNTAAIELFPRARSGALSALHGLVGVGATAGPMAVALATQFGFWAAAPLAFGAAAFAMAAFCATRRVHGLSENLHEEHARGGVPPRMAARSLTVFLYGVGEATFTTWAVVFLTENRGLPLAAAAGALSVFWLAMTVGRLGSIALVRRVPPFALALLMTVGMAAAFPLVAHSGNATSALLRFGFAGLSCSALFPLLLGLGSAEYPRRTPQVTAIFSATLLAGIAIGCFAVGPLRGRFGLERIYLVSAAGPVLVAVLLARLHHYGRSREET